MFTGPGNDTIVHPCIVVRVRSSGVQRKVLRAHKWLARGLVKFASAVAYHLCLNLPEVIYQPRAEHKRVPIETKWWSDARAHIWKLSTQPDLKYHVLTFSWEEAVLIKYYQKEEYRHDVGSGPFGLSPWRQPQSHQGKQKPISHIVYKNLLFLCFQLTLGLIPVAFPLFSINTRPYSRWFCRAWTAGYSGTGWNSKDILCRSTKSPTWIC